MILILDTEAPTQIKSNRPPTIDEMAKLEVKYAEAMAMLFRQFQPIKLIPNNS